MLFYVDFSVSLLASYLKLQTSADFRHQILGLVIHAQDFRHRSLGFILQIQAQDSSFGFRLWASDFWHRISGLALALQASDFRVRTSITCSLKSEFYGIPRIDLVTVLLLVLDQKDYSHTSNSHAHFPAATLLFFFRNTSVKSFEGSHSRHYVRRNNTNV